jgi:hypothetical protein
MIDPPVSQPAVTFAREDFPMFLGRWGHRDE